MATNSFQEWWGQHPPITRTLTSIATGLWILFLLNNNTVMYLHFNYHLVFHKFQVWRLATSLIASASRHPSRIFLLVQFYRSLNSLETAKFKHRSDLFYYLFLVSVASLVIGYNILRESLYLDIIVAAMTYTEAQEHPEVLTRVYFIEMRGGVVPWFYVLIEFVAGGIPGALGAFIGIWIGHMYLFLTDIVPLRGGPKPLATPVFLKRYVDGQPAPRNLGRFQGGGKRLGD